jgi:hypothetical protein
MPLRSAYMSKFKKMGIDACMNPELYTLDPKSRTLNLAPCTLNLAP